MPDFVPVAASIEFRITGLHTGGKKMYNIMHVDCGSPFPSLSEVRQVAETVAAWVDGTYNALWSSAITSDEVRARSNAEEPGPLWIETGYAAQGGLTGDMLPLNQSLCVNLLSGTTGQSRRGKFYVFPGDETSQTVGLYTVPYATDAIAALQGLESDLAAVGFALAIESRRRLALYQVESYLAQRIPSNLQSRKANRGI